MRGLFTAGVTDVLLNAGIRFDGAIGVSAGAAFGCNYKSKQVGRALRYNLRFCDDKRYCSLRSLIKTGDMFGADFCYRAIPFEHDPFDIKAFNENPMEFHLVCTDVESGKAYYKRCDDGKSSIEWMRASASLPLAARIVEIDGGKYLDGGLTDSVPIKYFESIGYDKNIVILTRPFGYVKGKNRLMPIMKLKYKKYPKLCAAIKNRHIMYNKTIEYVEKKEASGELLVIRPPQPLPVGRTEKDREKLKAAYDIGKTTAESRLEEIKSYLKL